MSRFGRLVPEAASRGSVLRDPAGEEQIAQAEERLGLRLPPSYRSFLLVSNGAYASAIGPEEAWDGDRRPHGFLPVEEVAPMAEVDAERVALWTGAASLNDPANDRPPAGIEATTVQYYEPLRNALLISTPLENERDVLVPRDGVDEWEFWEFHFEGASAFRSFADWMQAVLARPDTRPKPEKAEQYIADVAAGKLHSLLQLAEIEDPRAGDLACEVLEDREAPREPLIQAPEKDRRRAIAARTLGLLGEKRFVPTLLQAYDQALSREMRFNTLAALIECGATEAPGLIAEAAENEEHEPVRRWAARKRDEQGQG